MGSASLRVLLVGESWITFGSHIKGFNFFPTAAYEEGCAPLLKALDGFAQLTHLPGHLAPVHFPDKVSELQQYQVILFSDIGSDSFLLHPETLTGASLRPNRLRLVGDYVAQGGGFAMIGGYMSFAGFEGKAHYAVTPLAKILPVEISLYDDRIETPEGISPEMVQPDHPVLRGITPPWPPLLGYNRFRAKLTGTTLMQFEDDPFLVVGVHGQGRVAAYASDVSPHWGSPQFVGWQHYQTFWRQLVAWLAG